MQYLAQRWLSGLMMQHAHARVAETPFYDPDGLRQALSAHLDPIFESPLRGLSHEGDISIHDLTKRHRWGLG